MLRSEAYIAWTCRYCDASGMGHGYEHDCKEERNMEQQMEQVWRSKDGKCVGSQTEVEAYLKALNPLSKMGFPYRVAPDGVIASERGDSTEWEKEERKAIVAFANLAPLIQKFFEEKDKAYPRWRTTKSYEASENGAAQALLLAYEEALKQVPQ